MSHEIALIVAIVLPAVLLAVLRINAAMVFLSLSLGAVLVEYVAGEANSLLTLFSSQANSLSASTIQLVLLFAPAAVTCVVTLFSVRGRVKVLLNILPAAAVSAFTVLLAVPLLAPGLRFALSSEAIWQNLVQAQALIVGVGAIVSLIFLWFQRHHLRERERKRR